jgi:hypothetical protein
MQRKIGSVAAIATLALGLAAARAEAQSAGLAGDVTPYVGFLLTGNFIEGPLGVALSSAGGAMYGVQASLPMGGGLSLYGNIAQSKSDLRVGLPIIGGVDVGRVETLLYDGGIRVTLPEAIGATRSVTPFVQAGIGAIRHDISAADYIELTATNFAFNAGVGAYIAVTNGLGIRALISDYMGKFDAEEATTFDLGTRTRHNFAFAGGISIEF